VNYLAAAADVDARQLARRRRLWEAMQHGFLDGHPVANAVAHDTVYRRAMGMMDNKAGEAFDLSLENDEVRSAYGPGVFGQGCLLARRLIERGVPFVEVTLSGDNGIGWDTHQDNFTQVRRLSEQLDSGWGMLMTELSDRGLLEDTTILWMGEFGRTPAINTNAGRDHFPAAWTCVFGGGGIAGGQTYGKTTADGMEVADGKVEVGDVLSTLCTALGVPPETENDTSQGRPVKISEGISIDGILS
jgi:arylsulfatase A-like enzyme